MDTDTNPPNPRTTPEPDSAAPLDASRPAEVTPTETAPFVQEPATLPPKPTKSSKKWLWPAIALVIVAIGVTTYLLVNQKKTPAPTPNPVASPSNGIVLKSSSKAGSTKNSSSRSLAYGFVDYDGSKLQTVPTEAAGFNNLTPLAPAKSETDLSAVAFLQSYKVPYDTSLLMYDFAKKTTYTVLAENDGLVRHYYNPVILSDHFVAFYTLTYKDPVTLEGSVDVVNLLTGQKQELISDKAGNMPENLCCSVSPDGLYLVIPKQSNKLEFFSAGGSKVSELTTTAKFTPKLTAGSGDQQVLGSDDYAAAQLAGADGYPAPKWKDNSTLLLANSPPKNFVGATANEVVNGISSLSVAAGKLSPVADTKNYSISWFDVAGNQLVFAGKGPVSGTQSLSGMALKLYKVDLSSANAKAELIVDPATEGPFLLDKFSGALYAQKGDSFLQINIDDNSSKSYNVTTSNSLQGLVEGNKLIFGTNDATASNPTLEAYDLSTQKLSQIY